MVAQHSFHVRPSTCTDINENLLSEQCRSEYGLTEANIKEALPLEAVIRQFDSELTSRQIPTDSICLVTDGALPIRQTLFPETQRKGISLPNYYYRYHDLRKEFASAFPDSDATEVEDMLKCKNFTNFIYFCHCHYYLKPLETRSAFKWYLLAHCHSVSVYSLLTIELLFKLKWHFDIFFHF